MSRAPIRICVYAFSATALFFRALVDLCSEQQDNIEWSVIFPQGHFRKIMSGVIPPERCCYLYDNFESIYQSCGESEVQRAMGSGEGLHVALLKDKAGYRLLDSEEQLRRGAAVDCCYRQFLNQIKPDFILFPDLETVDGFIAMNLAQELGTNILYYAGMRLLGGGFFSQNCYEALPPYFGEYTDADVALARQFLNEFQLNRKIGRGKEYLKTIPPKPPWLRRLTQTTWLRWRYEKRHASEETLLMRITRNFLPLMAKVRRLRFDLTQSRFFDIKTVSDPLPDKYILYPLQMTPESSINGLEPYFVDQFRVIDAILLNLPEGHRLVVKEHPTMYGMRDFTFYWDARRRPGLIMAHPAVSMQHLIMNASVIATVTGTVGFESFLLGKPCLLFGRNFFSHLCHKVPALNKLKDVLTELVTQWTPASEIQKEIEIAKLLNVSANFEVSDPWFSQTVMAPQNIEAMRNYLWKHLHRLEVGNKFLNPRKDREVSADNV